MALTVAQLVARLTADTSGFYRGMAIANASMIRSGGIISRVAAGAGLATIGMGIMSLRAAGNFQESMNVLQAVSGATGGEFKKLSKEAIDLGRDMTLPNVSARDASEAMLELSKGGLSVNQVLGATKGTLQLGLAANIGYADSAVIVARAMKAFGLEGGQATKVADLFTAAANKSTADMTDVALGFQMASAQFNAGHQSIDALTTSIALMANAGVIGSDAGTSLKTMMNRLMAPTKKARDLMKDLGFEVYDSSGHMKKMPDLIGGLEKSLHGMTDAQRDAALYTIFGSDAIRASREMLRQGRDGWLKMNAAITKGGEAQAFAEARTKGFNGAVQALWSQIETLAIELGIHLLPNAEATARAMARFVGSIDADAVAHFFSQIVNVVGAIYNFIRGSVIAQGVLGGLIAGFAAFRIMSTVIGIVRGLTAAIWAMNAALLANPIVLIIAALVALGVGLYIAYRRSEEFRNIVNAAWASVRDFTLRVWPQIRDAVLRAVAAIRSAYNSNIAPIVDAVRRHWGTISAITATVWNAIRNLVSGHLTGIVNIIRAQMAFIVSLIRPVLNLIVAIWTGAFNVIKAIVTNAVAVITGKISLFHAIVNIVSAVLTAMTGIFKAQFALAKAVVQGAVTAIISVLRSLAGMAYSAATAIGSALVQGILAGVSGLAGALKDKLISGLKSAKDAAMGFIGAKSPSTLFAKDVGKPIADGIIRGYLLGAADLPNKIKEPVRRSLEAARKVVEAHRDKMKRAWDRLTGDALRAFDAITEAHLTPTEAWIKQQDEFFDTQRLQERLRQAQADLDKALAGGDPEEIRLALMDVEESQWAIDRRSAERRADAERKDYDAIREQQRRHLEDYLDAQWQMLLKSPEQWKTIMDQTLAMLGQYGIGFVSVGQYLGQAFAQGMRDSIGIIGSESGAIAKVVERILKLHSPAKTGPLSSLNKWWKPFAPTLLSGLDSGLIQKELGNMLAAPGTGIPIRARMGAGGGGVTINNPVFLAGDRDTARKIAQLVEPHIGGRPAIGPPS